LLIGCDMWLNWLEIVRDKPSNCLRSLGAQTIFFCSATDFVLWCVFEVSGTRTIDASKSLNVNFRQLWGQYSCFDLDDDNGGSLFETTGIYFGMQKWPWLLDYQKTPLSLLSFPLQRVLLTLSDFYFLLPHKTNINSQTNRRLSIHRKKKIMEHSLYRGGIHSIYWISNQLQ
jgi:hypothetical protein